MIWTGNANAEPPVTTGTAHSGRIVVPLTAAISNPRHRDPHPENNRDTEAIIIKKTYLHFRVGPKFNTLLEAQAGNLRPSNTDDQAVDFTLKLENHVTTLDNTHALLSDVTLDVTLSGLKVKTAPTTTELNGTTIQCKDSDTANDTLGACADGDDSAQWDIGFLYGYSPDDLKCDSTATGEYVCRQLTLKLALDGNMPLAQRCLEARIRSLPAPEGWQGGPVKVCLGADDPPRLLLEDGRADIFTYYPCVDAPSDEVADALVTSYPCDSTDTFEVAAAIEHPLAASRRSDIFGDPTNSRAYDKNSGKAIVKTGYTPSGSKVNPPETLVTVQVKDPSGRAFDSHATSVNGGGVVSWHTARTSSGGSTGISEEIPGVWVGESWLPVTAQQFTAAPRYNWGPIMRVLSVSGLGDASNPLPTPDRGR